MNQRRIIIGAMIGAIAISALSISLSLAWYSSSDRLRVSSFDIDMSGDVELLMSTSKELETFKEELTKDDLVEQEFLFSPVSSMYRNTWYDQKGDTPLFYDSSSPALDGVIPQEEATSGFFQKRIYLLSTVVDYYATLDVKNCLFTSNSDANSIRAQGLHTQFPEVSEDEITEKLNSLQECLRMSILVNTEETYQYYVIDPYKTAGKEVLFGGTLDNDGDGYYDYYVDEDGHKKEVIYGDIEDRSKIAYNDPVDPLGEVELINSKGHFFGNSFEAQNRIDTYTFDKAHSNGLKIATEDAYTLEELDGDNTELLIPCYREVPTEIVVSIYLEGWDKACINQTMGACFDAQIGFKFLRRIIK